MAYFPSKIGKFLYYSHSLKIFFTHQNFSKLLLTLFFKHFQNTPLKKIDCVLFTYIDSQLRLEIVDFNLVSLISMIQSFTEYPFIYKHALCLSPAALGGNALSLIISMEDICSEIKQVKQAVPSSLLQFYKPPG